MLIDHVEAIYNARLWLDQRPVVWRIDGREQIVMSQAVGFEPKILSNTVDARVP